MAVAAGDLGDEPVVRGTARDPVPTETLQKVQAISSRQLEDAVWQRP